jgi:hypothetical protein
VRPRRMLGSVVGRVPDDGVLVEAALLEEVEHQADVVVVLEHAAAVIVLVVRVLRGGVAPLVVEATVQVHAARVEPDEEGLGLLLRALHKGDRLWDDLRRIEIFHSLHGERPRVLDGLSADAAESRILGRVIGAAREGMQHAARAELFGECLGTARVSLSERLIVAVLLLLLRIQVVEIAEELVETVGGRQMLVAVAEMVLAEVAGAVAGLLHDFAQAGRSGLQAELVAGHADRRHSGANRVLAGDERRPAGRAGGLGIVVGEPDPFHAEAVDMRRGVAHGAHAVGADVLPADVVAPDDEDVGLASRALRLGEANSRERKKQDSGSECPARATQTSSAHGNSPFVSSPGACCSLRSHHPRFTVIRSWAGQCSMAEGIVDMNALRRRSPRPWAPSP